MPRAARFVWPGVPHHVTQRGNHRNQVFFSRADYLIYLHWLHEYAVEYRVDVLAYALMPNHVHLILVPDSKDSMHRALRCLHMRYAQRVNREKERVGHLWQGRYFAAALDETYFWAAIRYVERNPVRARLAIRAEDYEWSSAQAHCGLRVDPVLSTAPRWQQLLGSVANWQAWLARDDEAAKLDQLRARTRIGFPCGSNEFVESLEAACGRILRPRRRGRRTEDVEERSICGN